MNERTLDREARKLLCLREQIQQPSVELKTQARPTGLRIIARPIQKKRQLSPEEIKARREFFAKKNAQPLKQSLADKLKDFKIAA